MFFNLVISTNKNESEFLILEYSSMLDDYRIIQIELCTELTEYTPTTNKK